MAAERAASDSAGTARMKFLSSRVFSEKDLEMMEAVGHPVWVNDVTNWEVVFANAEALRLFGVPAVEDVDISGADPDNKDLLRALLEKCEAGEAPAVATIEYTANVCGRDVRVPLRPAPVRLQMGGWESPRWCVMMNAQQPEASAAATWSADALKYTQGRFWVYDESGTLLWSNRGAKEEMRRASRTYAGDGIAWHFRGQLAADSSLRRRRAVPRSTSGSATSHGSPLRSASAAPAPSRSSSGPYGLEAGSRLGSLEEAAVGSDDTGDDADDASLPETRSLRATSAARAISNISAPRAPPVVDAAAPLSPLPRGSPRPSTSGASYDSGRSLDSEPHDDEDWEATVQSLLESVVDPSVPPGHLLHEEDMHHLSADTWVRIRVHKIRTPQNGVCALLVQEMELTDLKRAEQRLTDALAVSNSKSDFVASLSHELRTPLNGVMGMLHCLQGSRLDDMQREFVTTAMFASTTLLHTLDDVLDLRKAEVGKLEIHQARVPVRNIAVLAEEVAMLFAFQASTKGLRVRVDYAYDIHSSTESCVADLNRIRQILVNFVSNAIKYTFTGGFEISVSIGGDPPKGAANTDKASGRSTRRSDDLSVSSAASGRVRKDWVHVAVKDSGIGVPAAQLPRLFSRFFRVEDGTSTLSGSSGLGLSITQQLARLLGGRVAVDSVEDEGSTFTFSFRTQFYGPGAGRATTVNSAPGGTEYSRGPSTFSEASGGSTGSHARGGGDSLELGSSPPGPQAPMRMETRVSIASQELAPRALLLVGADFVGPQLREHLAAYGIAVTVARDAELATRIIKERIAVVERNQSEAMFDDVFVQDPKNLRSEDSNEEWLESMELTCRAIVDALGRFGELPVDKGAQSATDDASDEPPPTPAVAVEPETPEDPPAATGLFARMCAAMDCSGPATANDVMEPQGSTPPANQDEATEDSLRGSGARLASSMPVVGGASLVADTPRMASSARSQAEDTVAASMSPYQPDDALQAFRDGFHKRGSTKGVIGKASTAHTSSRSGLSMLSDDTTNSTVSIVAAAGPPGVARRMGGIAGGAGGAGGSARIEQGSAGHGNNASATNVGASAGAAFAHSGLMQLGRLPSYESDTEHGLQRRLTQVVCVAPVARMPALPSNATWFDHKMVSPVLPKKLVSYLERHGAAHDDVERRGSASSLRSVEEDTSTGSKAAARSTAGGDGSSRSIASNVMIVDDNNTNLRVASRMVRTIAPAMESTCLPDGTDAVEAFAAAPRSWSIILMDLEMVKMGGLEAVRRIRAVEEEQDIVPRTPIVALTGHGADDELMGRCSDAGFDDIVVKPVLVGALRRAFETWVPDAPGM